MLRLSRHGGSDADRVATTEPLYEISGTRHGVLKLSMLLNMQDIHNTFPKLKGKAAEVFYAINLKEIAHRFLLSVVMLSPDSITRCAAFETMDQTCGQK